MKIHHIGYAVPNIEKSLSTFEKLGYQQTSEIVFDEIRGVNIVFLKNGNEIVELVAPNGANSDVEKILKKNGVTPYHICYEVENIESSVQELGKNGWFPIKEPEIAPAIGNRRVVFLFTKNAGMIELVETSPITPNDIVK